MGKFKRDLNGILLLDKPIGISSNCALQKVKRIFGAKKAGHTGGLDPLATGVLPLCFGTATKLASVLLNSDKHYLVTGKLGVVTNTGDSEGEVIKTLPVPSLLREEIELAIKKFVGTTKQVPPMFSALKHNGQPLYKLARQGIVVERKPRDIVISRYDLCGKTDDTLTFEIICSKGTYIRTLIEDLGVILGCGAHVIALRRLGAGPFTIERTVTMEKLQDLRTPLDSLLLPAVV